MGYPGRHNIYNATIRRMVQEALEAQEQAFRQEHENDTDQDLLAYVRANAFRLNHTPWPGEIPGGSYIEERFGSWNLMLAMAKLPVPRTANQQKNFARYNEEVERQKEVYRQRKAEKQMRAKQRMEQQTAKKKERQSDEHQASSESFTNFHRSCGLAVPASGKRIQTVYFSLLFTNSR